MANSAFLAGSAGVGACVSSTLKDAFVTSSIVPVDITGLSVTITPGSTTSKFLILYSISGSTGTTGDIGLFTLQRNGVDICDANPAGSRLLAMVGGINRSVTSAGIDNTSGNYLDSPNTLAPVTYKVQVRVSVNLNTIAINSSMLDTDSASFGRYTSTITVIEIKG